MNAITLTPSECEPVSGANFRPGIALPVEDLDDKFLERQPGGTHVLTPLAEPTLLPACPLSAEEWGQQHRIDLPDGTEGTEPWYKRDPHGIVRCIYGVPQTMPGFISPLVYVERTNCDMPAVAVSGPIGFGLAAAAWSQVAGEHTVAGRDVVLALLEDACPDYGWSRHETLCIAEHEIQPALDRVEQRMEAEPGFAAKFARARDIMTAASVYFPWNKGDGTIPG